MRHATDIPLPRHVASTDSAVGAASILRPGVNLWLWRRRLDPIIAGAADQVAARAPHASRTLTPIDDRHAAVDRLLDDHGAQQDAARTLLAQDMAALAFLFARLSGLARVQVRLEAATQESCPLFHVDSVPLRLLCTYAGAGTEWLADADARHDELGLRGRRVHVANQAIRGNAPIRSVPLGWVAIAKGRRFGDGTPGVVHRSPDPAGIPRLLLVIDQPMEAA